MSSLDMLAALVVGWTLASAIEWCVWQVKDHRAFLKRHPGVCLDCEVSRQFRTTPATHHCVELKARTR